MEATDKVWRTCCALHNMLLEADGLSAEWNTGVQSDWQGVLGQHESDDVNKHMPELIRRSLPEDALLAYDTSGMGVGNDVAHPSPTNDEGCPIHPDPIPPYYAGDNRQNRRVRDLSFDYFRGRLVEHFDILYQDNRIQWPTRMSGQNPLNS